MDQVGTTNQHADGFGAVAVRLRVWTAVFAVLAACAVLSACRSPSEPSPQDAGRVSVVATVGMIADIAREVGGDRVRVVSLMKPGVDPHLYTPTRSDLELLMHADVVLYNGLLLEGKMTAALSSAASDERTVVAVTDRLDPSSLMQPPEFAGHHDPHVWMDPRLWESVVGVIRDALIDQDPEGADVYTDNAASVAASIRMLDAYAERVLATVPQGQRVLVTAHDAFGYFGRRYGFEVVGIQGISTESEAGVRDIERLVTLLVDRDIGAVFTESTVSERNVSALVAGARARGRTVVVGGSLFSDAMGEEATYEGTYIGMIDHNVTKIARALGGDAPEAGMQGRLGR